MTQKPESTPRVKHIQGANPPWRHETIGSEIPSSASLSRRAFLGQMSGVTVVTLATGGVGVAWSPAPRRDAAIAHSNLPLPTYPTNGDEAAYPNTIASFTKGLPHNNLGEGASEAYATLCNALTTGQSAAIAALPMDGWMKLANPQAAYGFELEGLDPHQLEIKAQPAFSSAETAAEMVELYWQALTRDVPFAAYETHPLIHAAVADLSRCSAFRGPRAGERVTPATLFRGPTPGDLPGPSLSQFLWLDVPSGGMTLVQRGRVPIAGDDYLTTYPEWLNIQRGVPTTRVNDQGESSAPAIMF